MPPTADLNPVRLKFERANQHRSDFYAAQQRFSDACNNLVRCENNPDSVERVHYIAQDITIPDELYQISGDMIGNLRSALDRLAYAACVDGGQVISDQQAKHIAFPIASDAAKYPSAIAAQIQGLPKPAVIDAFRTLDPYPGGMFEPLYYLHAASNTDKHRLPLSLMHVSTINFGPDAFDDVTKRHPEFATMAGFIRSRDLPFFSFPSDRGPVQALKAGDVLLRTALHSKLDKDVRFSFEVAFGDPNMPSSAATLHYFRSATKTAIGIVGRAMGFTGRIM